MGGPEERLLALTLDGESLDLGSLARALADFRGLLGEVDLSIGRGRRTVRWTVLRLRKSSPAEIAVAPRALRDSSPDAGDVVARAVMDGLARIERDRAWPEGYPERALQRLQRLSELGGRRGLRVRISLAEPGAEPAAIEVTGRLGEAVRELTGDRYRENGSIDGRLEGVSIHGRDAFLLRHLLTGRLVSCTTDEATALTLGAHLGERVLVEGVVRSNARGEPLSVAVSGYRIHRGAGRAPQPEDLLGLFKDSVVRSEELGDHLRGEGNDG